MTLSRNDLKIGNIVHRLVINNNMMKRNKICMIDSAGNEWFRYDIPRWTYDVESFKIVGAVKYVASGVIDNSEDFENQYYLQKIKDFVDESDNELNQISESVFSFDTANTSWSEYFINRNDAMATGKQFCAEANAR